MSKPNLFWKKIKITMKTILPWNHLNSSWKKVLIINLSTNRWHMPNCRTWLRPLCGLYPALLRLFPTLQLLLTSASCLSVRERPQNHSAVQINPFTDLHRLDFTKFLLFISVGWQLHKDMWFHLTVCYTVTALLSRRAVPRVQTRRWRSLRAGDK